MHKLWGTQKKLNRKKNSVLFPNKKIYIFFIESYEKKIGLFEQKKKIVEISQLFLKLKKKNVDKKKF